MWKFYLYLYDFFCQNRMETINKIGVNFHAVWLYKYMCVCVIEGLEVVL